MNTIVLFGLMVCMVLGALGVPRSQPNTLVSSLQSLEDLSKLTQSCADLNKLGQFAENIDRFSKFQERFYIITKDDRVYAYGAQSGNLFGVKDTAGKSITTPAEITELSGRKIVRFCSGTFHMLALSEDGAVYAWGDNTNGNLGVGNNVNSDTPVVVTKAKNITDIQCNVYASFALNANKQVLAWGFNSGVPRDTGDMPYQSSPVQLTLPNIVSIATTSMGTTFALTESSELYAWGVEASDTPTLLPLPVTPVSVVAGVRSIFILTDDGDIYSKQMANDPELISSGSLAAESIYAVQDGFPDFLVAKALNGSIYFWEDDNQGSNSFQLANAKDIPGAFFKHRYFDSLPFMVKLSNVSDPTTTQA